MVRRLSRKTLLSRLLTMVLVVAFTASFTGVGGATPMGSESRETTATPLPEQPPGEELPAEDPLGEPEPETADEAVPDVPSEEPQPEQVDQSEKDADEPSVSMTSSAVTPTAVTGVSMTFEGYRQGTGWTTGNIKAYYEDEYVPLRLVIENKGSSDWTGSPVVLLDHYNGGVIGWDATADWHFNATTTAPGAGDSDQPPSTGAISVTDTFPGGYGASPSMRCVVPSITVPVGQYGTVYFRGHLALTEFWLDYMSLQGAQAWPGASLHVNLEDGGAKTLPIPVPLAPTGSIEGLKFEDLAPLGSFESENGLGGWEFTLTRIESVYPFSMTATSSSVSPVGTFAFDALPAGTYQVTETPQAGWQTAYALPLTVTLPLGGTETVRIGNYRPSVIKTFSLALDSLASNVGLHATYQIDGGAWSAPVVLTGTGPYSGSVSLPFGTHITGVRWYATYGGVDVLLYEEAVDETLTSALTNPGDYDSSISGHKFSDDNVNGVWDKDSEDGLNDWEIHLLREVGSTEVTYAVTHTNGDGYYEFQDVIPGSYRVVEVQQSGYYNAVSPLSDIVVPTGGASFTDLDFGNVFVFSDIEVTKSGPDKAHVGDTIEYTIVVSNAGSTPLHDVSVVDPMFSGAYPGGVIGTIPVLGATPVTFKVLYQVQEADADPLVNTVLATGVDLFGSTQSDEDSHEVDILHPELSVAKTVDFNGDGTFSDAETYYAGAPAVWRIEVSNEGDSSVLGIDLSDSAGYDFGDPFDLASGETTTFTYTTNPASDTTNTVTATAIDELESPVGPVSDDAAVDTIAPALTVSKLVDFDADGTYTDSETNYIGETASWRVMVANTGDDDLMVDLADSNGHDFGPMFALPSGETTTFVYTTTVLADTVDTVTATYYDSLGADRDETSSATALVVAPGELSVDKTVDFNDDGVFTDDETYYAGETATWKVVVSNEAPQNENLAGGGDLFDVMVSDTNGMNWGPFDLASGETTTFTYVEDSVSADKVNTATASATDELMNPTGDVEDSASVNVISPSIDIEKTSDASEEGVAPGTSVIYTFVVTNGPEPLTGVVVSDPLLGFTHEVGDMEAGESVEVTTSAIITENTTNTVYVTGVDELENTVTDDDTLLIEVFAPFDIDMGIVKTADRTIADPGETVTYTLKYTNYGDAPVSNFTITDDFDERYATVTDSGGGTVTDGKIVWQVGDSLLPGESGSIVYRVRIDEDMPVGETRVDNVAVVTVDGDENATNDESSWRVTVALLPFTPEPESKPKREPFLPFTGGDAAAILISAAALASAGGLLRRRRAV